MITHRKEDQRIAAAINACVTCSNRGLRAEPGDKFGVLVTSGTRAIGVWSHFEGAYRFRRLADWQPSKIVGSLEELVACTRQLAEAR